jgi:DNA polymerase III epsilon subunit family exonuclease
MTNDISTLDFVAFDTETTGLSPHSESLVELAGVRFNLVSGPKEYFQTFVHPGKPIPPNVSAIHGITDEMVADAPTIAQVLPSFYQFVQNSVLVAHNAPFDIGFVALHSLRSNLALPEMPILDSCMFARRVCLDLRSHRLSSLVDAFSLDKSTFHRALADAKNCMEIFRILIEKSCGSNACWDSLAARHGKIHFFQDANRPVKQSRKVVELEPIFRALEEKRSLWILYEGGYGPREISPLLLYAKGSQQYMEATCHIDGIRKSFRLDRIQKVLTGPKESW